MATVKAVNIRIEEDVLDHFRAMGGCYQTNLKRALREYIDADGLAGLVERQVEKRRENRQEEGQRQAV